MHRLCGANGLNLRFRCISQIPNVSYCTTLITRCATMGHFVRSGTNSKVMHAHTQLAQRPHSQEQAAPRVIKQLTGLPRARSSLWRQTGWAAVAEFRWRRFLLEEDGARSTYSSSSATPSSSSYWEPVSSSSSSSVSTSDSFS